MTHARLTMVCALVGGCLTALPPSCAAPLLAGVGRIEITDREAGPVHDPAFMRAL